MKPPVLARPLSPSAAMNAKLLRVLTVIIVAWVGFSWFALLTSPIEESYVQRIPLLVVIGLVGATVAASFSWSANAASRNRHGRAVATSLPGIASTIGAIVLMVFVGWAGVFVVLGVAGLIALAGTVSSSTSWIVQRLIHD